MTTTDADNPSLALETSKLERAAYIVALALADEQFTRLTLEGLEEAQRGEGVSWDECKCARGL